MLHCTHRDGMAASGRLRLFAAALAFLLVAGWGARGPMGSPATAAEGFLSVIEDIPLAPGLTEAVGEAVMFDSPGGRIVEALAEGRVGRDAVTRFYSETLPQLGWQRVGTGFRREGEELSLELSEPAGLLSVRFRLRPAEPQQP
ncbi:MAG: hypothetical protein O3A88_00160 [Proteobacteria bacterium]|nr:hypothetical protein [Pseudomonadota bacterium]